MAVSILFNQPGAEVRYTIDGTEPNEQSQKYEKPILITTHSATIKTKAVGKNFLPSGTISAQFFKEGLPIRSVGYGAPNSKYTGNGPETLIDNQSGTNNHASGEWLGFDSDSVVMNISLMQAQPVQQLLLHLLNNQSAWIFMPQKIMVYNMDEVEPQLLVEKKFAITPSSSAQPEHITLGLEHQPKLKQLQVVLYPANPIPDWHQGKGNKGWLFIDEIKIY